RPQNELAELTVLLEERPERLPVERDVAQRLRHFRRHEDRLPGEQVQLAEEARRPVAHDLPARRVLDRDLAVPDRDERIPAVADAVQHLADGCRALLADLAEPRELRRRERGTRRGGHSRRGYPRDGRWECLAASAVVLATITEVIEEE